MGEIYIWMYLTRKTHQSLICSVAQNLAADVSRLYAKFYLE